jgi:hypothetical protein
MIKLVNILNLGKIMAGMGVVFWLLGAYALFILKYIFDIRFIENLSQKFAHTSSSATCPECGFMTNRRVTWCV